MIDFAMINRITERTLSRDNTFFSNPNRHKIWDEDKTTLNPSKIADLSLECVGYGQFHVSDIVNRFIAYFSQCTRQMSSLKNLRLKINGFDLKQCPNLISEVCKAIDNLPKGSLKLLQLQTTKLLNCEVNRDFGQVIRTSVRLGIKQRHGAIKAQNCFQTLILQFADWQFIYKKEKSQPSPQVLKNQLGIIQDEAFNTEGYCFKKFRLEMSTWYYTQKQSDVFLHSFKVQQFHTAMDAFVKSCYTNMPDLQYFQLDLRNWYSNFQLGRLRNSLMMIPKEGAQNMSINSKNISRMKKGRDENPRMSIYQQDHDDEIILFQRHIIV